MTDYLGIAKEHGLQGHVASAWGKLQGMRNEILEDQKNGFSSLSDEDLKVLAAAADVILDQHKQIEQLGAMTTI